jgi:hypothetical protein
MKTITADLEELTVERYTILYSTRSPSIGVSHRPRSASERKKTI